jgi:dinuclear metal center YbgI/SA1388 family protein
MKQKKGNDIPMIPQKKTITVTELTHYLDHYMPMINEPISNGIQVGNTVPIQAIATAVSASLETIEKARTLNVQALIVHHGLAFKNGDLQSTEQKKIALLKNHNIALLCYHLPLDAHPDIGNNWKAARDLGLKNLESFLELYKTPIGVIGYQEPCSFELFKNNIEAYYEHPAIAIKVKDPIGCVALVSGGADKFIQKAAQAGADCLITGKVDEPAWDSAHEEHISFFALGHYATETVGPKALAEHLNKIFTIPCTFIKTNNPF